MSSAAESSNLESSPSSETPNSSGETSQVVSNSASKSASVSSAPEKPTTVRVTIPEGFTLLRIAKRLDEQGVCKEADFIKAATTYNFSSYSLIKQLGTNPKRYFKLEGYLFPNTYDFNLGKPAQDAVGVLLRGAQDKIAGKYSYPGMTTDQIVTLASMIEKESGRVDEMKKISAVFHNRLKAGMRLQADVTRNYVNGCIAEKDIDTFKYYYNTYRCNGLPAGPICNPGANALNAAIHPQTTALAQTSTSTAFTPDAMYFAADSKGNYYYAKTFEQHKANLAKGGIVEGTGMQ